MNLIDNNERNMIAGPSNGSDMKVRVENPQELAEQQNDLKNDLPTTSAGANDWRMEISDETEGMHAGTEEIDFNNESVLTKTMDVLKDKAGEAYSTLNDIEKACAKKVAETMNAVGLSLAGEAHEYTELVPMGVSVVEEDLQHVDNDKKGTVYVESNSGENNSPPLRNARVSYLNPAIGWIRTNITQNSPLKIVYTVPFFILASILLGMIVYSMVMIFGLFLKDFDFSFKSVVFALSSLMVDLFGIFVVKCTLSIFGILIRDLWNRKTKGNIISILGIILCTVLAFVVGFIYPFSGEVHEIEASLSWLLLFLFTIFAFFAYTFCFGEKIKKEMHNQENVPKLDEAISALGMLSILMTVSIVLIYFTQPITPNNLFV
ncbi:uncharacterized protein NESG_01803 [Nematocida ausubeli]|uniref:Uncharacterized protein n=1 Tax=Nematocida ausubeli (strain ATCC PRA-371 / ERTm2) TaxID=1913371 RepID=A0A086J0Z9_NEMA1|nr:uncharacterized protein NESG_01803 [Nematocida ausubeli]KFG25817.1 hypothetical protein NESG_01803 [Nematocida ausubeli]